jgi:hypothetical protein
MILHDAIEDRPKCMSKLLDIFGHDIYTSVLELSKESNDTMVSKFGVITNAILTGNSRIVSNLVTYTVGKMANIFPMPSHIQCAQEIISLYPFMQNDLRNYQFFWKIYALSEDQFERKVADRVNNLNNLTHVSI